MASSARLSEHPVTRIRAEDIAGLPADIESQLACGNRVEIVSAGKVIGEVRAPEPEQSRPTAASFNFQAQRRQLWGDRLFNVDTTQWIREDRDARG